MNPNPTSSIGSFFDQFKNPTTSSSSNNQSEINNLLRHMSVPNGVPDNGTGAGRNGSITGGNMMNQSSFMRSNSTMPNMKSPGSNSFGGGFINSNNRSDVFNSMG